MNDELVTYWEGQRVTFELNRPDKRNALSGGLIESLIEAVDDAHANHAEVMVFRGAGKNFSAGFDFTGWQEQSEGDLVLRFIRIETLLQKVVLSPALTVALAHGRNFGAGVDLFGVCDLRVAGPKATFCMPGLKFGLVLGTRRFAACVGEQSARPILAQGRTFDALEASTIGFVTNCADVDYWAQVIQDALAAPSELEPAQLSEALRTQRPNTDLAHLVRSAAEPGLKARIAAYLTPAK